MTLDAVANVVLPWIIRIAGLLWLIGAFALIRQIRMEMALDRMTTRVEEVARDFAREETLAEDDRPRVKSAAEKAAELWQSRDDAARRGWIAGQAVVLAATGIAMLLLHPAAAWLVALLVMGQGVYFIWREYTARRAPSVEAGAHARPSARTVNAGWFTLFIATLVWTAAFRGLLGQT
jgi:Flp pilus assembly protein TadB